MEKIDIDPLGNLGRHANRAGVRFDGPFSNCQAESSASRVPRPPLIDSIETIEYTGSFVLGRDDFGCSLLGLS
jgi:hypothetical protein